MPVAALPDFVGAVIARLASFTELTALCGTTPPRISGHLQDAWFPDKTVAQHAIWISEQGTNAEQELDHLLTRVDLHCFGSTGYEARRLWRTAYPILCPTRASGRATSFLQGAVRVWDVAHEAGPILLIYPETSWNFVFGSFRVRHGAVAAA